MKPMTSTVRIHLHYVFSLKYDIKTLIFLSNLLMHFFFIFEMIQTLLCHKMMMIVQTLNHMIAHCIKIKNLTQITHFINLTCGLMIRVVTVFPWKNKI